MQIETGDVKIKKEGKPNKTILIISILLVVVLLVVIGIVLLMKYVEDSRLAISVDGQKVSFKENTFIFQDDDVYISIKKIAPLVGYEVHNGEYKVSTEDTSKMYVEAKDESETTSFYLNSTTINKVVPDSTNDYESVEIDKPVTLINDDWYISQKGFMKAFNCVFGYNSKTNRIKIQTLPYLVAYYEANISEFGYSKLSEEFNNKKALIYGMIIGMKESNEKYGVYNITKAKEVISPRYNNVEFIEGPEEFIITNGNKMGIAYANRYNKNKCKL